MGTCTLALNLKSSNHTDHGNKTDDECAKDGPHPNYFTVQEMMKFTKDKRFKDTIQGFMDYFHKACHSYQVWYVRGRIAETLRMSNDGKKPKFFSIIKLLKIRKDKRFKKF